MNGNVFVSISASPAFNSVNRYGWKIPGFRAQGSGFERW